MLRRLLVLPLVGALLATAPAVIASSSPPPQAEWSISATWVCPPSGCAGGLTRGGALQITLYSDGTGRMNRHLRVFPTTQPQVWDITGWVTGHGSRGPDTLFFTAGTVTIVDTHETHPISPLPRDSGILLVPGHYETSYLFGEDAPPGYSYSMQVTAHPSIWDPAMDWRNAPYQQNPSPDAYGHPDVWSYLSSAGFTHDPTTYFLMPDYLVQAEQWNYPDAGNLIGHDYAMSRTIRMHSSGGRVNGLEAGNDAILAWTSPVSGRVRITGHLTLGDPACNYLGDGIIWSIDQGATALLSQQLAAGAALDFDLSTIVTLGTTLYFIHDPGWDSNCDTVILTLLISK